VTLRRRQVPAVAVVGYKNTGKTTLVMRLIAAFKQRGLKVGTCKHDRGHGIARNEARGDTWKHRQAGADLTLVSSAQGLAELQVSVAEEPSLQEWLELLSSPLFGLDLILVEGWKRSELPKIVLLGEEPIGEVREVLAYVADRGLRTKERLCLEQAGQEIFERDDVEALVRLIVDCVRLGV
jgi:molybdopterin-guanine dinucleotide biosynthesis protein B